MINKNDLYRMTTEVPFEVSGQVYGTITTTYEVRQLTDMRNLSERRTYCVACRHRIYIPNKTILGVRPANVKSYKDYPAMLTLATELRTRGEGSINLLDYDPRTLNATIQASATESDGTSNSWNHQSTSGSSTSQTNNYGVSLSGGIWGKDKTGSISADFSHADTVTSESSLSDGNDFGVTSELTSDSSMSIKDWGAYAYLDQDAVSPTWLWCQEYPWNVLQYRVCKDNNVVNLPNNILNMLFRIVDGVPQTVFPPSQLSLFGIDFSMKALWQVGASNEVGGQDVTLVHTLNYLRATHGIVGSSIDVHFDSVPIEFSFSSPSIDLTMVGLDPILHGNVDNGAVVGFASNKFIVPPKDNPSFKIISSTNNLQVSGSGFSNTMSTRFDNGPVKIVVDFKIVDDTFDYAIHMKHWVSGGKGGCTLEFTFNGDRQTSIRKQLIGHEGEGGDRNLTSIVMRNKDYASRDYHDYLRLGINTVEISIERDPQHDSSDPCEYTLRAIAINE